MRKPGKNRGGRSTLYRPELCDEIVQYCAQGFSLTAFCGHKGLARADIYNWELRHPAFAIAMN
jgi:hypothetical protein